MPHVEPLEPPALRDAFARLIETAHNKVIASQY
jgi:hypothetical protein